MTIEWKREDWDGEIVYLRGEYRINSPAEGTREWTLSKLDEGSIIFRGSLEQCKKAATCFMTH